MSEWVLYDHVKADMCSGGLSTDDVFYARAYTTSSNANDSSLRTLSEITGEAPLIHGYGPVRLATSWDAAAGGTSFVLNFELFAWEATDDEIVDIAYVAVAAAGGTLLAFCRLDAAPATVLPGHRLGIGCGPGGLLELS